MSVSGINGSAFSAYNNASTQAEAQQYAEDSQVLSESLQIANLSATSAATLQQPVSALLNSTSTLNALENSQTNTATLIQSGPADSLTSAQPGSFGIESSSSSSNPDSKNNGTQSALPNAPASEAQQAYTANNDSGTSPPASFVG
jgi:hypothetical protein